MGGSNNDFEQELRLSEERYRSLVNSADAAISMIGPDGCYLYLNAIAAAPFGKAPEAMVGVAVNLLFPPEQAQQILTDVTSVIQHNEGKVLEAVVELAGDRQWYRTSIQPVRDASGVPFAAMLFSTNITDMKLAEERLVQSEEKYKTLFYESPDGYLIIHDGKFVDCNKASEIMLGGDRSMIIGKTPAMLSPEFQPNGKRSTLYEEQILQEALSEGRKNFEWVHKRFDGGEFLTQISLSVVVYEGKKMLLKTWKDITQQRRTQEALLLSERRYSQIAEHSRTVIWEVDPAGRYTYVNKLSELVYGYSPTELIGKMHFYELIPYDIRKEFELKEFDTLNIEVSSNSLDKPILKKDGASCWVSTNGSPIYDLSGSLIGYRGADIDITQRKLVEEEMQKFRTISDQASYGTAISTLDGKLLYVNEAYAKMHGWLKEELQGRNISLLYNMKQYGNIRFLLDRMKLTGIGFVAQEVWRIRKDGSVFPSLMSSNIIVDSNNKPQFMSATVLDITEIKQKETELKKLNIAITQSPVAIVITDTSANIQYASPAFEKITGYRIDEMLGKNANLLKSGKTNPEVYKDLWRTIQAGSSWNGEWINRKKNGEFYIESVSVTPILDEQGTITSYLAVKEDITERRQAEQDRVARDAAEVANKSKSAFLSNMSHEIRTPLNAIIGFAQILKRDQLLNSKQSDQVQTILRSGEHLMGLINDILDLSRIEAGQQTMKTEDFNLYDLLEDLQMMFSLRARDKGIALTVLYSNEVPRYITADQAKLRQILINLMGNAVKFTASGEVKVTVSSSSNTDNELNFSVSPDMNDTSLSIAVEDSGPGISETDRNRIFESFWQAELGQKAGGTGLGLAICKSLIQLMGGKLEVDSTLGVGSNFHFEVPVKRCQVVQQKNTSQYENVIGLKNGLDPYRVLVVDDRKDNRDMLCQLILPVGFEVMTAENGKEALEIFAQWKPHAVLMDMNMPIMDGYEATRIIKAMPEGPATLVAAITASAFGNDVQRVLDSGTDAFLSKPFRAAELFEILSKLPGLLYEYADTQSKDALLSEEQLSSEQLSELDSVILQAMRAAVEQGNISKLKELIEEIKLTHPVIADGLLKLAKNYDYEKLSELLQ